jgi:integrase
VLLSPYNDEGAQRDFRNIRRADVIELVEDIVGAGKHAAANRVHALISKVFSFAVDANLLDANPAARLKKRGVEKPRPRVLADKEILAFLARHRLQAAVGAGGLGLRLALLTAARASEVAGARKDEFRDLDNRREAASLIPGGRTKNKRNHLIPLSPLALETAKEAVALAGDATEFLFPTRLNNGGPIDRNALTTAMARFHRCRKEPPSPHDLRRTANTRLAMLGGREGDPGSRPQPRNGARDPESRHYNR